MFACQICQTSLGERSMTPEAFSANLEWFCKAAAAACSFDIAARRCGARGSGFEVAHRSQLIFIWRGQPCDEGRMVDVCGTVFAAGSCVDGPPNGAFGVLGPGGWKATSRPAPTARTGEAGLVAHRPQAVAPMRRRMDGQDQKAGQRKGGKAAAEARRGQEREEEVGGSPARGRGWLEPATPVRMW